MRHRSLRELHAFWNQIRGARVAPTRTEIDPRTIAGQLGDLLILEGPREDFRVRLAGSRVVEALQRDLTGRSFTEIWSARCRAEALTFLTLCAEEGEPVLIGTRLHDDSQDQSPHPNLRLLARETRERRRPMQGHGEVLLLPLLHHGRLGERLLGAFALANTDERSDTPKQLDITGTRILGRDALPASPLGLISARLADQVLASRGHLILLRGEKPDIP